jgi:segregation and condensation protein A
MADTPENPNGAPASPAGANDDDVFESQLDAITIKVQAFEGPLDLLVHLIKKSRMNVYDIQIAVITRQYLEYLDLMQELNLDVASEFLVMAATLIHIKSKMLLPRPETAAGDPVDEEDPRDALVRRLIEHQQFKAAAELLHDKETLRSAQWARPDSRIEEIAGDEYEPEIEVDLFSLLSAFKQVLERARERPPVLLPPEEVSIESRIEQLLERLSETEACGFEDLFEKDATRGDMIVTFLAMLEMIRLKLIRVFQQGGQGAIRVYKRARPTDAPHPIHDPEDEYKAHHPGAGSREPEAGSREQEAGSRQPEAGTREPEGGSAERAEEKEDDQQ